MRQTRGKRAVSLRGRGRDLAARDPGVHAERAIGVRSRRQKRLGGCVVARGDQEARVVEAGMRCPGQRTRSLVRRRPRARTTPRPLPLHPASPRAGRAATPRIPGMPRSGATRLRCAQAPGVRTEPPRAPCPRGRSTRVPARPSCTSRRRRTRSRRRLDRQAPRRLHGSERCRPCPRRGLPGPPSADG